MKISKNVYIFLIGTSFLDSLFYFLNSKNGNSETIEFSVKIKDFLYFIPVSFAFEIIFDFFHYVSHLAFHKIKFLYVNFHKLHHTYGNPTSILTFYQHPFDYICTNMIPLLLTYLIVSVFVDISNFQLLLILTYKTHIEIGGHCGKINKTVSFPQCIVLPKLFNIGLYTLDHNNHHSINNCNYSKRFILWDKVFNTYVPQKNRYSKYCA